MKTNKITKRFLLMFLMIAAAMIAQPIMQTQAASPKVEKQYFFTVFPESESYNDVTETRVLYIQNHTKNGKVSNIKSSDETVFKAAATKMSDMPADVELPDTTGYTIEITPAKITKKASATLTFEYEGKKYSTIITVKPWENPCKSLKVGNKDFSDCWNDSASYYSNRNKTNLKGKIKISAKSGWKITEIKSEGKKIKNRAKINATPVEGHYEGIIAVEATFKNKQTKETIKTELFYTKWDAINYNGGYYTDENWTKQ